MIGSIRCEACGSELAVVEAATTEQTGQTHQVRTARLVGDPREGGALGPVLACWRCRAPQPLDWPRIERQIVDGWNARPAGGTSPVRVTSTGTLLSQHAHQ